MKCLKVVCKSQQVSLGGELGPIVGQLGINMKTFSDFINKKTSFIFKGLKVFGLLYSLNDRDFWFYIRFINLSYLFKVLNNQITFLDLYKLVVLYSWYNQILFKNALKIIKYLVKVKNIRVI